MAPETASGALASLGEAAPRLHSEGVSLLRPLSATILSQRVGPDAQGAQVTQGAAHGHPAEAVGVVVGSVVAALRPQAQGFLESLPEAARHDVVEHRVNGRAEVKEDAGDDMHVLEGQVQALGPLGHKAPHEAVNVERGPADPKHHDQHNCRGTEGRLGCLPGCLPLASG